MVDTITVLQNSFRLKIPNISQLEEVFSPECLVQGIPWKIKIKKTSKYGSSLGIYLYCTKSIKHAAFATFELISFNSNLKPYKVSLDPHIFDSKAFNRGLVCFIQWKQLIDEEYSYVKNDAIILDVTIVAESSNYENRSALTFDNLETCCDEGCLSTFRITVTNIEALFVVRSEQFMIRNLPWDLSVYRSNKNDSLSMCIQLKSKDENISCKLKTSIKIIASKDEEELYEKITEDFIYSKTNTCSWSKLVSWSELLKTENELVNDNSIVLEVKIKADKPEGGNVQPLRPKLECSICIEPIGTQELSSTPCGHLYCSSCITNSVKNRKMCPLCNTAITLDDLRRIYLPV